MAANLGAAALTLSEAELTELDALDHAAGRVWADPATFEWPQTQD